MGLLGGKSSSQLVQLLPFNPPIGVHPQFAVPQPTTLVLKEKALSLTGDDFSVRDAAGVDVVRVSGKALSIRDQKDFYDISGNHLFHLKTKLISIHKTFTGAKKDGTEIFQVKKKFSVIGDKMVATWVDLATKAEVEIRIKGSVLGRSAVLELPDGRPVAQISEKLLTGVGREMLLDRQTYFVTVAPGVDLALIAAICICFDEVAHEGDK